MKRTHLYMDEDLVKRLDVFLKKHYGESRMRSIAIRQAVKEWLDKYGG